MILTAIGYCLLLIGYCLLLIAGGIWILTPVALFFTWPLLAWSWWYDTDSIFTPADGSRSTSGSVSSRPASS